MIGREQFLTCTSDGTLFATCHLLKNDVNNTSGYVHSYIHRSTDRGRSWQRIRIVLDGYDDKFSSRVSRNVLELPDRTLLLGVGLNRTDVAYLWSSQNSGETWDKGQKVVKIGGYRDEPYDNEDCFFTENWLYRNTSGKLLNFLRCGPPRPDVSNGRQATGAQDE